VLAACLELFPDFEVGELNRGDNESSISVGTPATPARADSPGLPRQGLRRVAMRRAWSTESEAGADVLALDRAVVIRTPGRIDVRSRQGDLLWTAEMDSAQLVRTGETSVIVGARRSKTLELRDAATGDIRRRADVGFVRSPRSAHALADGTLVVQDETRLIGIGAGQGRLWTHDFRDRYSVVSSGAGLIALSTGGRLEGLNAAGETCWSRQTALELNETLQIDHAAGLVMAAGRDEAGFPLLIIVSASDGSVLAEQRLTPGWMIPPVLAHGRIFVPRQRKNRLALLAIDASTGREAFDVTLPVQPGVLLHAEDDGHLLVSTAGGEWLRLTSAGVRMAHHPPRDPDSALSPRQPRFLLRLDKLIVTAGTHLHLADAQTGRPLATLEPGDLTLTSACALTGPVVVTAGADGLVEAWESRGHIGVVSNRFSGEDL
jgi:hypothetical protein